jgi:membrane-associated phospholipid phosphatase
MMLSPFEPLALPAWIVLVLGFAAVAATLAFTRFEIRAELGMPVVSSCLMLPTIGMLARRYGMLAVSDFLQANGALALISLLMQIGCFFITPLAIGWADTTLAAADELLRFPWLRIFHWFQNHPDALDWNRLLYRWLMLQPSFVALLLIVTKERERLWTFVNAWAVALVITLAVYIFFPARGPFWLNHIAPHDLPGLTSELPWKFPQIIEHLRDGSLRVINREFGTGLVSFPSFHACGAVLLAWAMWSRPILRYPFLVLNIGVAWSAIISGGHYFVDLPGGVAVALLSIVLVERAVRPEPASGTSGSPGATAADRGARSRR